MDEDLDFIVKKSMSKPRILNLYNKYIYQIDNYFEMLYDMFPNTKMCPDLERQNYALELALEEYNG